MKTKYEIVDKVEYGPYKLPFVGILNKNNIAKELFMGKNEVKNRNRLRKKH